jgi:hypothetical protein
LFDVRAVIAGYNWPPDAAAIAQYAFHPSLKLRATRKGRLASGAIKARHANALIISAAAQGKCELRALGFAVESDAIRAICVVGPNNASLLTIERALHSVNRNFRDHVQIALAAVVQILAKLQSV